MEDPLDPIRKRIEHEDNLTCQRLSFLVSSQAFLLSAFAITLNGPTPSQNPTPQILHLHELLLWLLPLIAIFCIVVLYCSILGGLLAMGHLRKLVPHDTSHISKLTVQGTPLTLSLGQASPILVPLLFIITWVILLVV